MDFFKKESSIIQLILFFVVLSFLSINAQSIQQYQTTLWFQGLHSWKDSISYRSGDSIAVYNDGIEDSISIKTLQSTSSANTIITSALYFPGGGGDMSLNTKVRNISGTLNVKFEWGIWNGLGYSWNDILTTTADTTHIFNVPEQSWGGNIVSNEIILRITETGSQQNRYAWVLKHFKW